MSEANEPATATMAADRSTEFVATTGGPETSSAAGLLITAYILMWALVLVFVWATWRRQSKLDTKLRALETALGAQLPEGSE